MTLEYRFVLTDFVYRDGAGRSRFFEAGRSYPMPHAVARAATKRRLASESRPQGWTPPDIFSPIMTLERHEVARAQAELQVLKRYVPGNEQSAPNRDSTKLGQTQKAQK